MNTTIEQLEEWMKADSEDEHLEFKEARASYEFDHLARYCTALANERGGKFILGVTDKRPRKVVGTQAFDQPARTKAGLYQRLHILVEPEAVNHPQGRVLIFHVPSRPRGVAVNDKGTYWRRVGDELRPMDDAQLRRIHGEAVPDFSAEIPEDARLPDLDPHAIELFRQQWITAGGTPRLSRLSDLQLLSDAHLVVDRCPTNAALVLMGTRTSLRKHQLGQAEIVFEYRGDAEAIPYDDRENFQEGFFLVADRIYEKIKLRNEVHRIQEGLFRRDIRSFQDEVVREALLNAVAHRDYQLPGSVFVRQSPHRLVVESPGGFPEGVTAENIMSKHVPRNRLIAETFERCGYVERSGQGVDLMYEDSIREAKLPPDYSGSDDYSVRLTLWGEVQDDSFVRFLDRIATETSVELHTEDYILLDRVRREQPIPPELKPRLKVLRGLGVTEVAGYGKGQRPILSQRYYDLARQRGKYTREKGLDRDANRQLLLKHIQECGERGCRLAELRQVQPALTSRQVQELLKELKEAHLVCLVGKSGPGAYWHAGADETHEGKAGND